MSEERPQKDVNIFMGVVIALSVLIFVGIFLILRKPHDHPHASTPEKEPEINRELQPFVLTERSGAEVSRESISNVGSSRVDLQACKLEYSIVSPK